MLKPGLTGAAVGAVALAIVGFGWGGWVTGGSARDMASKASNAADAATALTELKAASTYSRKGLVEKAGWATPLGADKPNSDLAQACQLKLAEAF